MILKSGSCIRIFENCTRPLEKGKDLRYNAEGPERAFERAGIRQAEPFDGHPRPGEQGNIDLLVRNFPAVELLLHRGLYLVFYSRGAQVERDNDGHGEYQDREKTGNYRAPEMFSFEI